jgi:hypothetical protein
MSCKILAMMILLPALVAGCATVTGDTYCDVSQIIMFDNQSVVDRTDADLLRQIVRHNETVERLCE